MEMSKENLRPIKNTGGYIRRLFDLQVAATYRNIFPLIKEEIYGKTGKAVDVGCGAMPYRSLFPDSWNYLGIDTIDAKRDFDYSEDGVLYYDGYTFPLNDGEADLIFHSEVMEHIFDTRRFLSECNRILKTGGAMIFAVPFAARYHYIPYDYWRFTPSCLERLLADAGFTEINVTPRSRDVCVAAYKVLSIGYRLFFSKSWWRTALSVLLAPVWIASLIIGQVSLHLSLGSEEDSLGYVCYCRKHG